MALAAPDLKRQVQPQVTTAPPEYKPFEEAGKKRNSINETNKEAIKSWLNRLKPGFFEYLEQKKYIGGLSAYAFSRHLWDYLTLYKGELIGFYLGEASWELLFSALGPIGNMMRAAYFKNYSWKMAWQKNLLNPNSIYYYMQALPTRAAFDAIKYPGRAAFAILQKGGAPLLTRVFVPEEKYDPVKGEWVEKVKEEVVFGPLHKAIQASHIAADTLDKAAGTLSLTQTNQELSHALTNLKNAKTFSEKQEARWAVNDLVKKIDSTIFKRILGNAARRLRSTERDPLSFLVSLIGGAIWDLSAGLVLNLIRKTATTALNLIPGFITLRAQIMEFFTSNRWLNTANIGGITTQSFFRGVFSPTTVSSGYLGYSLAGSSPLLQAVLTPTFAGLGAFYNIGLKMAANPQLINWLNAYDDLVLKATDPGSSIAEQNYYRTQLDKNFLSVDPKISSSGFGPGTLTRFAGWLNRNWLAGLAARSLMLNLLPANVLASEFLGLPLSTWANYLPAIDYFWQIKGKLFEKFIQKWTQPTWNILGRQVLTPYFRVFSLQNPASIAFRVRGFFGNWFYERSFGTDVLVQRRWFSFFNRNVKPFAQNAFNPGFFMGFGFSQLLIAGGMNPVLAYVVGPLAGSLTWNAAAFALEKTFGMRIASMAKINAWGWTGYIVGSIAQLIFPALPSWFGLASALAFPAVGMLFSALNISLSSLLASIIAPIYTAITGLTLSTTAFAGWMAAWSTAMAVGSIAALTVFFAYSVFAGFWVPMIQEGTAGPQSSNFSINTNVQEIAPNKFRTCSSFNLSNNVFNSLYFLEHKTDISQAPNISVDLTDPTKTTSASRQSNQLTYSDVGVSLQLDALTPSQYAINYDPSSPIIYGGALVNPVVLTYLSSPDKNRQNLFDLMRQNSSIVFSFNPFFDILKQLAEEHGQTKHLVAEYEAQLDLMKEQKKLMDDLIPLIKNSNLTTALSTANGYLDNNPLNDPCPDPAQTCPEEKQTLKQLYDSWENLVNRYSSTVNLYINQTDPQLDNFLASLEQEQEGLKQQIGFFPDIINQMENIQSKLTDEEAQLILSTNFLSFSNLTPEQQETIYQLLEKYFKDVFDRSHKFYFIPQGTNYQVCLDMDYSGPAGVEQTVCSTISYTPSVWGPNTAFAKSCTTFTP